VTQDPYLEPDFHPVAEIPETTVFVPGTSIEFVHPWRKRRPPEHVLFDFDGTLSLIREGWPEVMVPMMVEILSEAGAPESPEELQEYCYDFVMQLNGKQTIYQMIRLAEEVRRRGGTPLDPLTYKRIYHERLMERIAERREGLRSGKIPREQMLVPFALEFLEALQQIGCRLYLASGTDEIYVREEAALLGLDRYFGNEIHGAVDAYRTFSKAAVIERILRSHQVPGDSLVGFGDGYVEIQNVKAVGGLAVAAATDERNRSGRPDRWKRERLIRAGADLVIPDYRDWEKLIELIWRNP